MAVTINARDGYGQVEPNHISAPRDGRVYAQLPAATGIDTLEQGMFVKYDYAAGEVNFTGAGPWFMVYNEEKLYDERHQMHKDFAQLRSDNYDGKLVPRVFGLVPGDIWTTNTIGAPTTATAVTISTVTSPADFKTATTGSRLAVGTQGYLVPTTATDSPFKIAKITTLPDGQQAVKIQYVGWE